ncbi:MAG: Maf family protein, partial [Anaerolineales bacterium]
MLLLASASPRRRELMELTGWDVEICPVPVNEMVQIDKRGEALAIRLART